MELKLDQSPNYIIVDFDEKNDILLVKFKNHNQNTQIVIPVDPLYNTYKVGEDLHNYIMTFQPIIQVPKYKKTPVSNAHEIYKLINKKYKDDLYIYDKKNFALSKRNFLLNQSDWTQIPDINNTLEEDVKILWKEYRQKLRDITNQPEWPLNIEWPKAPNTLGVTIYD